MEGSLIFVKHAMPELKADVLPSQWKLGEKGRSQSLKFSAFLKNNFDLDPVMYSSKEDKAFETAQILGETLSLEHKTLEELGEINRAAGPILDEDSLIEVSKKLFQKPSENVLGNESANSALQRFERGVQEILKDPLEEERLVVTHGTVLSLFLEKYNKEMPAFEFWQKFSCPSYVVVNLPDFKILELNGSPLIG